MWARARKTTCDDVSIPLPIRYTQTSLHTYGMLNIRLRNTDPKASDLSTHLPLLTPPSLNQVKKTTLPKLALRPTHTRSLTSLHSDSTTRFLFLFFFTTSNLEGNPAGRKITPCNYQVPQRVNSWASVEDSWSVSMSASASALVRIE